MCDTVQGVTDTFTATSRFQPVIGIKIYACNNNTDCYTDVASMRKTAIMSLNISDPTKVDPPESYKITVSFSFGSTEFHVVAKDNQTGQEVQTDVVFIAD